MWKSEGTFWLRNIFQTKQHLLILSLEFDSVNATCYDPVLFEQLTGDLIKWVTFHAHGAAGLYGMDAYAWRRLYSSFGSASVTVYNGLTAVYVAYHLCFHDLDSAELMGFVACQLVSLEKNGVHPIGIGDVPQRIISKAILHVIGNNIQLAAGALQTQL